MIPFDRAAPPTPSPAPPATPSPQQVSGREAAAQAPADGRTNR